MNDITQKNYDYLTGSVFSLKPGDKAGFEQLALQVFALQYQKNALYKAFCDSLGRNPEKTRTLQDIPFLPIEFFKTQKIITNLYKNETPGVFTSSGTSQTNISKHYVSDLALYETSFLKGFEFFYGKPSDYCILALLPSYLGREGSSLVYMANRLIELSGDAQSGFFLRNYEELIKTIESLKAKKPKTLLLGVSYALLDLAEKGISLNGNFIVMETGGMKGKREEMLKEKLHQTLKNGFGIDTIHSEYGMTELLSQAYSKENGLFESPPWMQVLIRDTNDPFSYLAAQRTGGINVIDLANLNSCAFIATQDLGKKYEDGKFELMGRFDNSDVRGCNLLIE